MHVGVYVRLHFTLSHKASGFVNKPKGVFHATITYNMGKKKYQNANNYLESFLKFFSSRKFFYIVLVIAALQGLWYITSFKPWIYDEARHFKTIEVYTTQISPFIHNQDTKWDYLGDLTRDGSYMYYYLMSWPLRLFQALSNDFEFQLISLRLVSMAFFLAGLIVMRRALLLVKGFSGAIVNFSLLFFVLTPAAGFLAGIVNYDNLSFLLYSLLVLLSLKLVTAKSVKPEYLLSVLILAIFMTLVKWTSSALIFPLVAYVLYDIFVTKKYSPGQLYAEFSKISRTSKVFFVGLLLISTMLFIERPVNNVLTYGKPDPSCGQVIGDSRCQASADYAVYAKLRASVSPEFSPVDPVEFTIKYWFPIMSNTMTNLLEQGEKTQLPLGSALYKLLAILSVVMILVALRDLVKDKTRLMVILAIAVYVVILIFKEYSGYKINGGPVAIRARYLVPVLPLIISLSAYSFYIIFGRYRKSLMTFALLVILLQSQGGGIVTYTFTSPESAYWNETAYRLNNAARNIADPFVKD